MEQNNIHVKEINNFIYIDPNAIVSDNQIKERGIEQEKLVTYVKLEADIVPRTSVTLGGGTGNIVSVASGVLNTLSNKQKDYFDTSWTENYINGDTNDSDDSGQSFGIESITINIGGINLIPEINIKFIDVRGKTLFENQENSPYNTFFHVPWPIFYLTLKGYYGKAIKYRLHLVKFNSQFNSDNGNFEIETSFIGSTYAFLTDIPFLGVLNAPFLYKINKEDDFKYNEQTELYEKKLRTTSKGYNVLKSVYDDYKRNGLIDKDFPVKTLREVITIARSLEKIIERHIFEKVVSPTILSDTKTFGDLLIRFSEQLNSWGKVNLIRRNENEDFSYFSKNVSRANLTGTTEGSISYLMKNNIEIIEGNQTFGTKRTPTTENKEIKAFSFKIRKVDIEEDSFGIKVFFKTIQDEVNEKIKDFEAYKKDLEKKLNEAINDISINPEIGIGFKPTIRNVFAIIVANAETYIRMLKEVHEKAMNVSKIRKDIMVGIETDSNDTNVYPWPEIREKSSDGSYKLQYPGSQKFSNKLQVTNTEYWPEIDFLERFYEISTMKVDTITNQEISDSNINYIFESDVLTLKPTSPFFLNNIDYYNDTQFFNILQDIWKRAKIVSYYNTFDSNVINEITNIEKQNIEIVSSQLGNEIDKLKNVRNFEDFIQKLTFNTKTNFYSEYNDNIFVNTEQPEFTLDFTFSNKNIISDEYEYYAKFLKNYKSKDYRLDLYPFKTQKFLSYIEKSNFSINELTFHNIFKIDNVHFVTTNIEFKDWVKTGNTNILQKKLLIKDNLGENILNTPYFHKKLFEDINRTNVLGKYVSSAYLFLNSLAFKNFHERINGVLISSLFREVSATHKLPFFLILKWGSQFHRFKKYLKENVDILENVSEKIDTSLFFDNNKNLTYQIKDDFISYNISNNDLSNIGLNPYYQNFYYKTLSDKDFYDVNNSSSTGYTSTIVTEGDGTYAKPVILNGGNGWYSYIRKNNKYFLLPSNGNFYFDSLQKDLLVQNNFKTIWSYRLGSEIIDYSSSTFPEYNEEFCSLNNVYELTTQYKEIFDLISVFNINVLEKFEELFLQFSDDATIQGKDFPYYFTDVLKKISVVESTETLNIERIKILQHENIKKLSEDILTEKHVIFLTLSNPMGIDGYIIKTFLDRNVSINNKIHFKENQVESFKKSIELILGFYDDKFVDFFRQNDIELNEENIRIYKTFIYLYVGHNITDNNTFKNYVRNNIYISAEQTYQHFISQIVAKIKKINKTQTNQTEDTIINKGLNNETLKLELYNFFKLFNDRWVSGNAINGNLFEQFLFLDKSNRDIGDDVFINITKLVNLFDAKQKNKLNLFSVINSLIFKTGFDIRVYPSYVNFSNKNYPSQELANSVFGVFEEVDYEESKPKVVLQFVGNQSKHLDLNSKNYKYKNDSTDIQSTMGILTKSFVDRNDKPSRAVGFEVNFGDRNQSIFKSIQLNQNTIKNTTESFDVLESLARSEGGNSVGQVDISLFDYYKLASYTSDVTCFGNVMIQPTMYFYLNNIPMFKGTYWIIQVVHNISQGSFQTTFKGVRIPNSSLPNPNEPFLASFKDMFDKLVTKANNKVSKQSEITTNPNLYYKINPVDKLIEGEDILKTDGATEYGLKYNSDSFIKKVKLNNVEWFKTNYIIEDFSEGVLDIANQLLNIKVQYSNITNKNKLYGINIINNSNSINKILKQSKTLFHNPLTRKTETIDHNFTKENDYSGPVKVITNTYDITYDKKTYSVKYGISISKEMASMLGLEKNGIIYFKLIEKD